MGALEAREIKVLSHSFWKHGHKVRLIIKRGIWRTNKWKTD